jgi:TRIAD3 protein (E3 ubiquitin-protein ligase RNF216)
VCPHTDGCDAKFHDRDLKKALSIKLYNTYCGIIQRKELEDAGIEGLESCPYCNFAVIIENQEERLFNCQSDECGKVSCRKCRKHVSKNGIVKLRIFKLNCSLPTL